MSIVVAEFDGRVFVPQQPVELPVGTKVAVSLPQSSVSPMQRPREPTQEERREWQEFIALLNSSDPCFPTVEDALGQSRKYPGYHP